MLILAGWTGLSVGFVLGTVWAWAVRAGRASASRGRRHHSVVTRWSGQSARTTSHLAG